MGLENHSSTLDLDGETTVHRLGLGAMRITGEDVLGPPDSEEEARDLLERAVDLGIDFIDTADSYGPGTSERLIAEALHPYPDDLLIATKGGLLRNLDGEWVRHGDPAYLHDAVLSSLDRLRTDCIDLYQLHRPDPEVPIEDSVTELAALRDEGVIEHIGVSNVSVSELDRARDVTEIATVQNQYNLGYRDDEDVLEACEEAGIGFIPWFPLGAGDLSSKRPVLGSIAAEYDATVYQIALAWLLQHSPVTMPIPGTSSVSHLEENVAATDIELTEAEMSRLSE